MPGPCDPEDLIDGIIFAATYLGCTHLLSERTPTKSARMQQAQEAMNRVRVRARSISSFLVAGLEMEMENLAHNPGFMASDLHTISMETPATLRCPVWGLVQTASSSHHCSSSAVTETLLRCCAPPLLPNPPSVT